LFQNLLVSTVDVWSVGCILAELLGRRPLFQGKDCKSRSINLTNCFSKSIPDINQVATITDILGTPPEDEIQNIKSEPARNYIRQMGYKPRISYAKLFPKANPLAIDLLEKMLAFDPTKRISVDEAINHPYLQAIKEDTEEEMLTTKPFNFDFEKHELNKGMFQELIWRETLDFHPDGKLI
jgi:serine/threonine protein kinase